MHPVEAATILSHLAYIAPATEFAKNYITLHGPLPLFSQPTYYTPQFNDFTYASGLNTIPESAYTRTLFLMKRDEAVLTIRQRVNARIKFYCVNNKLYKSAYQNKTEFEKFYRVQAVQCPKGTCKCPPPHTQLTDLKKNISALRKTAPFVQQLKELRHKVQITTKRAQELESGAYFPAGTLLANFSFKTWNDLAVDPEEFPKGSLEDVLNARVYAPIQRDGALMAQRARKKAESAKNALKKYISTQENAAFAVFRPELREIVTVGRENRKNGYLSPKYTLTLNDLH